MKKILLIEDNRELRENTAEILELAGYQAITAPDGKKGVNLVMKEKPDLIICDIMMPVLDGYGVLHMLANNSETASIPFIFLTARTERSDFRKGMEMGADDFITKPFDKIELLNAVDRRLKKADALKKEYQQGMEGLTSFIKDVAGSDAVEKFTQGRKVRTYDKKEYIYREGEFPRGIYYVNSGKIKVIKINEAGKEFITNLLAKGDFFGYTALLEERDYKESAQALDNSEVIFIPRDEFNTLVYNNREVAKKFLQLLTKNVSEHQYRLLDLAYSSVRKRVAKALLQLQGRYREDNSEKFSMAITREDLANIVGTATESLIRTLSDLKEEKLIDIHDGKIYLVNEEKLKMMKG